MTSCKSKEEKPSPPKDEKEKIPKELSSLEEKSEEIIKEIEKLQEEKEKPLELMKSDKAEKKDGNQEMQEGNGEEQSEDQQEGQSSEQKQEGKELSIKEEIEKKKIEAELAKKESIMKMWESISEKIEGVHTAWNDYEIIAIEDGASEEDITKFEDGLNKLTIAVEEKKDIESFINLNNMNNECKNFSQVNRMILFLLILTLIYFVLY